MSTTSHPWKKHLLRQAGALDAFRGARRCTEASAVKLEETVVLGFYAINRLIGGYLLTDAAMHRPIPMTAYPLRRPAGAVRLGDEAVTELYDLEQGRHVSHDLLFAAHQVLHNCALVPRFEPADGLTGILVTSDHQRKVAIYGMRIETLSALFRAIGEG